MTATANDATNRQAAKLPTINWLIIPLLLLGLVVLMIACLKVLDRRIFGSPERIVNSQACLILNDPVGGSRGRPGSACSSQLTDGALTEYRYNNCGDRSDLPCAPKPPGTYRIVLLGTSYAEGMSVPWDKTFAATLPLELSRSTGREVELYSRALEWRTPHVVDRQFQDTLKMKPDLVLYAMDGWDIVHSDELIAATPAKSFFSHPGRHSGLKGKLAMGVDYVKSGRLTMDTVIRPFQPDVWRHYLYASPSIYLKQSLLGDVDYLRTNPSVEWKTALQSTAAYLADIQQQAKAAGIPFAVTVLPQRPQAIMISEGTWPPGYDPYLLGESIRAIVEKNGGTYLDMLSGFRSVSDAGRLYYRINNHPNSEGQQFISEALARSLSGGGFPELIARAPGIGSSEKR